MATDNQLTLVGNLTEDPTLRFTPSGDAVTSFRIAQTPRFKDPSTGEWKDGDTLFLTCNAWRKTADNVAESLVRGSRVTVIGRLKQREYEKDGVRHTVYECEADEVSASLKNASAKITRNASGGFSEDKAPF
jgi:single-strand DNA-binding protein